MRAIITVGVSASGKSTWATQFVEQENRDEVRWQRVERDCYRRNLQISRGIDPGPTGVLWSKWKWKDEKLVDQMVQQAISEIAAAGCNLIVSDTNLNPGRRQGLVDRLSQAGYQVEIREFPISWVEACKRDTARPNGVGTAVLARQFEQWNAEHEQQYVPDPSLPRAIIVDVDGTLAHMTNRGPFEWDKVSQDEPNMYVIETVRALYLNSYVRSNRPISVIVLSGRDGNAQCRSDTEKWLNKHSVPHDKFYMREAGDQRPDAEIKAEIFWRDIAPNYNVMMAIDDRPVMVRKWRAMGLNTLAVGNQQLEF